MTKQEFQGALVYGLSIVTAILIALFLQGCSSVEHRQQQLQEEHPECFVFSDLTIECPNPFDSAAGFGTTVINQKKRKSKK